MAKYFVKKGIQLIIVTILISFFSFAVIYAAPGDISGMYLNEQMSDEEKEAIRENLGLNKSMPEQYWGWAKEVLKGISEFLLQTILPYLSRSSSVFRQPCS